MATLKKIMATLKGKISKKPSKSVLKKTVKKVAAKPTKKKDVSKVTPKKVTEIVSKKVDPVLEILENGKSNRERIALLNKLSASHEVRVILRSGLKNARKLEGIRRLMA